LLICRINEAKEHFRKTQCEVFLQKSLLIEDAIDETLPFSVSANGPSADWVDAIRPRPAWQQTPKLPGL
jgi:hypothetical protein